MPELPVEKTNPRKNPTTMVLADIPGTAFDKVSMDIVGPLLTIESGHSIHYILTIQDLLTKYSMAVPFKQATSAGIAKALVEKFINPYTAPKAWISKDA